MQLLSRLNYPSLVLELAATTHQPALSLVVSPSALNVSSFSERFLWQLWSTVGDLRGVLRQKQHPDTPWTFRVNRYATLLLVWYCRMVETEIRYNEAGYVFLSRLPPISLLPTTNHCLAIANLVSEHLA